MKDREKLTEVFAKTEPMFAKKVGFSEALPTIAKGRVEIKEYRSLANDKPLNTVLRTDPRRIGEYYDCSNIVCYQGGVQIGDLLRQMVDEKSKSLREMKSCIGYEGSPKGRHRYRSCAHRFEVSIELEYKEES